MNNSADILEDEYTEDTDTNVERHYQGLVPESRGESGVGKYQGVCLAVATAGAKACF